MRRGQTAVWRKFGVPQAINLGDAMIGYSAAIAALIAKAKLAGRWIDRAEQRNTNVVYAVSDKPMTEGEWIAECVTEH